MAIDRFFKDNQGKWKVAQAPNSLISIWAILQIANSFILHGKYGGVSVVASMVLFAWAYLEFTDGDSSFRKLLGLIVLVGTVVSAFMKN
jgi:hypothetical protein